MGEERTSIVIDQKGSWGFRAVKGFAENHTARKRQCVDLKQTWPWVPRFVQLHMQLMNLVPSGRQEKAMQGGRGPGGRQTVSRTQLLLTWRKGKENFWNAEKRWYSQAERLQGDRQWNRASLSRKTEARKTGLRVNCPYEMTLSLRNQLFVSLLGCGIIHTAIHVLSWLTHTCIMKSDAAIKMNETDLYTIWYIIRSSPRYTKWKKLSMYNMVLFP